MNQSPPADDAARSLNERFVAYLDQLYAPRDHRRRYILAGLCLGTIIVVAVLALALVRDVQAIWPILPLGVLLIGRAIAGLQNFRSTRHRFERLRTVVRRGLPVTGYLVQANATLFKPGGETLPCLVLFSFQPEVEGDADYMRHLADRIYALKNTTPSDTDGRYIAGLTTDERAVPYRRRRLPYSFTDGSTIYCADLWVKRAYLPGGYLRTNALPCLAEPGETGGIELVPAWLLTETEEMALPDRRPV
jgi:hypothetical protein